MNLPDRLHLLVRLTQEIVYDPAVSKAMKERPLELHRLNSDQTKLGSEIIQACYKNGYRVPNLTNYVSAPIVAHWMAGIMHNIDPLNCGPYDRVSLSRKALTG